MLSLGRLSRGTLPLVPFLACSLSTTSAQAAIPTKNISLFGYSVCPFYNKVKAYVDYHEIPYEHVEVRGGSLD